MKYLQINGNKKSDDDDIYIDSAKEWREREREAEGRTIIDILECMYYDSDNDNN